MRTAVGKQATPRNVQTYTTSFNKIFDRFMEHIRTSRGENGGMIDDFAYPLKLLLTEGERIVTYACHMPITCHMPVTCMYLLCRMSCHMPVTCLSHVRTYCVMLFFH